MAAMVMTPAINAAELDLTPMYSAELCWSGASLENNKASWTEGWGGIVFNLENKDYSGYNYVVFEFAEPSHAKFKLESYYAAESDAATATEADAASSKIIMKLDQTKKGDIAKIALMSAKPGSTTISKAVMVDELETDPVLFEGSVAVPDMKKVYFKLGADKFIGLKKGQTLTVEFTTGSLQQYASVDFYSNNAKLACQNTRTNTKKDGQFDLGATYTSTTIAEDSDVEKLQAYGLQIKGRNVTITKVTLADGPVVPDKPETPDTPDSPADNILWTGEAATGSWANDVTVDAPKFAALAAGDKIAIYLNVDAGKDYGNIELADQKYTKLAADGTGEGLDNYGCIQPDVNCITYELGAADVALLKKNGLRVKGANITVTKIERIPGTGGSVVTPGATELWTGETATGSWANDVTVDAPKFAAFAAGDKIAIYLKVDAGKDYGNIELDDQKYTKLAADGTGEGLDNYGCIQPDINCITYELGAADVALLKKNGLRVKGANITVTKIERIAGDGGSSDIPGEVELWSGNSATGNWANDVTVDAPKFANVKGGDIISIYLGVDAGKDYGNIELDDQNYTKLSADGTAVALDRYGCIQPDVTQLDYTLTSSDAALLKANGLRVKGANITISRITLTAGDGEPEPDEPAVPTNETVLWSGSVNCGQWAQTVHVAAEKWAEAKVGDKFKVNLKINAGKGKGIIKVQSAGADLEVNGKGTNMDANGNFQRGASEAVYELTEGDLAMLSQNGLTISGFAVTISQVSLLSPINSGISDVAVDENVSIEYYNLNGIRVDEPTPGIYIRRQGNKVSKVIVR